MAWRKRRSAYYSRNQSYSRSYNAERAEADDRYPRTRAAKHLGLSTKAFDAGCAHMGYVSHEWHHVGKYANMVDYYDTKELAASASFWLGAVLSYKTKAARRECRRIAFEHLLPEQAAANRRYGGVLKRGLPSPIYGHPQFRQPWGGGQNCVDFIPLGAVRALPVNGRFLKILAGPGFPPGAIVDKSLFNDFRVSLRAA